MYTRPSHIVIRSLLVVFCMGVVLLLGWPGIAYFQPASDNPLQHMRQRLIQAGNYRFMAEVQQVLIPRGVSGQTGSQEEQQYMQISGEVVLPDRAVVTVQQGQAEALTLVQRAGELFVMEGGELRPAEHSVAMLALTLDLLSYLDAAHNIQALEQDGRVDDATTGYRFEVDGAGFAEQIRDRLAQQPGKPILPPGVQAGSMAPLATGHGRGEVWLDGAGLPSRQQLTLHLPEVNSHYAAEVTITTRFSDVGAITTLQQPVETADGGWELQSYTVPPAASGAGSSGAFGGFGVSAGKAPAWLTEAATGLALAFVLSVMLWGLVGLYRRAPRQWYSCFAIVMGLGLVGVPLLAQLRVVEAAAAATAPLDQQQQFAEHLSAAVGDNPAYRAALNPLLDPAEQSSRYQQAGQTAAAIESCGDGTNSSDTDGDGLTDLEESCLGTDAYEVDTDLDLITDTLEVDGVTFGGRSWPSDPFLSDTNFDGLNDDAEWPLPVGSAPAPAGDETDWDPDGDGIPNLWDEDNDGDGVSDGYDLAPFSVSETLDNFRLTTTTTNTTNSHQYIHVQIRPENPRQLAYYDTPLDWPDGDGEGQITDLDSSRNDLRLIPMLEITTNVTPTEELAENYGLSISLDDEQPDRIKLYAPLFPTNDDGVRTAYETRVAYEPGQLSSIEWDARMVWFVQAQVESETDCLGLDGNAATCIASKDTIVQTYPARFQVTGLQVHRSNPVEVALMASPQLSDDDAALIQLASGLATSFFVGQKFETQAAGRTFLEELTFRLNSPNTPLAQKFFIDEPMIADHLVYPHQDAATFGLAGQRIPRFLEDNYDYLLAQPQCQIGSEGQKFACAALIQAKEWESGGISLDELAVDGQGNSIELDFADLQVNLSNDILMTTQRSVQLLAYRYRGGAWRTMEVGDMLEVLRQRYDFEELAVEVQAELPGIAESDLEYITYLFYLNWMVGQRDIVGLDGFSTQSLSQRDAAIAEALGKLATRGLGKAPEQAIKLFAGEFSKLKVRVAELQRMQTFRLRDSVSVSSSGSSGSVSSNLQPNTGGVGQGRPRPSPAQVERSIQQPYRNAIARTKIIGIGRALIVGASIVYLVSQIKAIVCATQNDLGCVQSAQLSTQIATGFILIGSITERTVGLIDKLKALKANESIAKLFRTKGGKLRFITKITNQIRSVQVAYLVAISLELITVWTVYGISQARVKTDYEREALAAQAAAQTTVALILFIAALIPFVDVAVAILLIIDFILDVSTGGKVTIIGQWVTALAEFFYTAKVLTKPKSFDFVGGRFDIVPPPNGTLQGPIVGNQVIYSDTLISEFEVVSVGYRAGELSNSYAELRFRDAAPQPGIVSTEHSYPHTPPISVWSPSTVTDSTTTTITYDSNEMVFDLRAPAVNQRFVVEWSFKYYYRYREEILDGLKTETKTEDGYVPENVAPEDHQVSLVLDVLPNTVDGLWEWSVIEDHDIDGDGLVASAETAQGTSPTQPDSDGDGLLDGDEVQLQSAYGTVPSDPDSDDDGLLDGQELQYGTLPNKADSDDDGLRDNEEVYHQVYTINAQTGEVTPTGQWAGGWVVILPGTDRSVHIIGDGSKKDTDNDGLDDSDERDRGLSPYTENSSPRLAIDVRPPGGESTTVYTPESDVELTLNLLSVGQSNITGTLELCLPAILTNVQGGSLQRTANGPIPTRDTSISTDCSGQRYAWTFRGGNEPLTLRQGETVSTTIEAQIVDDATARTISDSRVRATLGYEGELLEEQFTLLVDQDPPTVAFNAPRDGDVLRGESYVVAGGAVDDASGVEVVQLTLPLTNTITLTNGAEWAYTWQLPPDGTYALSARARDLLGQMSQPERVTVIVDNTAPTIDLIDPGIVQAADTDRVTLTGTASDGLSGLSQLQIQIDGRAWQTIMLPETYPQTYNWSYEWRLPSRQAEGAHRIVLRAFDRAGNISERVSRTVVVDDRAPTFSLATDAYEETPPPIVSGQRPVELAGMISDRPANEVAPDPLPLTGSSMRDVVADATVWLEADKLTDMRGATVSWLGDVDGDGRADLAVGLPNNRGGAGEVLIVTGKYAGWPLRPNAERLSEVTDSFYGVTGAGLGTHVVPVGDVNGDDLNDLLIGDPANNRVFLIFGSVDGLGRNNQLNGPRNSRWVVFSGASGWQMGEQFAAAGDVNGDGYDDLLLGASDGANGQLTVVAGQAQLWPTVTSLPAIGAALVTLPIDPRGAPATGVGDVNGDGLDDIALADPRNHLGGGVGVYLLAGQTGFTSGTLNPMDDALAQLNGATGELLAPLGNVNSDLSAQGEALTDFVYGDTTGQVRLVTGRETGTWDADIDLSGRFADLGGWLAAPGDVNADGYDDLLLGSRNGTAYLLDGSADPATNLPLAATLAGVAGAASTPYAAGADLNCDTSSDLLLIPDTLNAGGYADPDLGEGTLPPFELPATFSTPSQAALPVAHSVAAAPPALPGGATLPEYQLVVDDECGSGCSAATLQAAVDMAKTNGGPTQITVQPGQYAPVTIAAADGSLDGLTIIGVNPDAVFIDGNGAGDGLTLTDVKGVTLANLTIRNVARGVQLTRAGVEGYARPQDTIRLDRLLIHDVTSSALAMDRVSTAEVRRTTLVADANATSVYVDPNMPDLALSANWNAMTNLPHAPGAGGGLVAFQDKLYSLLKPAASSTYELRRLDSAATTPTWERLTGTPFPAATERVTNLVDGGNGLLYMARDTGNWADAIEVNAITTIGSQAYFGGKFAQVVQADGERVDSVNVVEWTGGDWAALGRGVVGGGGVVYALATLGDDVYVGGDFTTAINSDGSSVTANNIVRWSRTAKRWYALGGGLDGPVRALLSSGLLYAGGDFSSRVAAWNTSTASWANLADTANPSSLPAASVRALAVRSGALHAASGCDVYRYSTGLAWSNAVSFESASPGGPCEVRALAAMGSRLYIGGQFGRIKFQSGQSISGAQNQANNLVMHDTAGNRVYVLPDGGWSGAQFAYGVPGPVNALEVLNSNPSSRLTDQLHVGGTELQDGAEGYAIWNGSSLFGPGSNGWTELGGAFLPGASVSGNTPIRALAVSPELRLLGGKFEAISYPFLGLGVEMTANGILAQVNGLYRPLQGGVRQLPNYLYSYNTANQQWKEMALPFNPAALASTGDGNLYASEVGTSNFYRYDISANQWEIVAAVPDAVGDGHTLQAVGGFIFALRGNAIPSNTDASRSFYRYNPATNGWVRLATAPLKIGKGAALVWDGGDYLFATGGGNGTGFAAYDRTRDSWLTLQDVPNSAQVNEGGGLAQIGTALYLTRGGGTTDFFRYGPVGVQREVKLTFEAVAFVAPPGVASANWLNGDLGDPFDFLIAYKGKNSWVNNTSWASPAPPTDGVQLTATVAQFLAPRDGLYRIQAGSQLETGYQTSTATAYVSPDYGPGSGNDGRIWGRDAFASIQNAINSGAPVVYLLPGRYREAFWLASGVRIVGSDAERTILEPPPGASTGALIRAEHISGARLARLTLTGNNFFGGLRVVDSRALSDGTPSVLLSRSIIRDTSAAVELDGDKTEVHLDSMTIVNNTNGVVADSNGQCGRVDVRNSVLAYQSNVALRYADANCSHKSTHTFNAYWANSEDLLQDGQRVPPAGAGELTGFDPLFSNIAANTYRLRERSPLLGAGTSGPDGRRDIGYRQQERVAATVDVRFCATCTNDGLEWGVDAFASIQAAVDSANPAEGQIWAIRVRPGTYVGNVSLKSQVRLLGSGADTTIIDGNASGSVITLNGGRRVEVRGFTIRNSGSVASDAGIFVANSESVTITHNLIRGNQQGISFSQGAVGTVRFNTFVNQVGAGVVSRGSGTVVTVNNSILADNTVGLQTVSGGEIVNDYNLLYGHDITYYDQAGTDLTQAANEIVGRDPRFRLGLGDYRLRPDSPAVNAAEPFVAPEPLPAGIIATDVWSKPQPGGGARADMGYQELLGVPLVLLFGAPGRSCAVGSSGVAGLDVGSARVVDITVPVTETTPAIWTPANVDLPGARSSFWNQTLSFGQSNTDGGLYRLYGRATDVAGNGAENYLGQLLLDNQPPSVAWVTPPPASTSAAALELVAETTDYVDDGSTTLFTADVAFFEVGQRRYPAIWDNTGWDPANQTPRTFRATVPVAEGTQQIRAVVVDRAGNVGTATGQTDVTTVQPVAAMTMGVDNSYTNQSTWLVEGYVRYDEAAGLPGVEVQVQAAGQSAQIVQADLATQATADGMVPWQAVVPLTSGVNQIAVRSGSNGTPGAFGPPITVMADYGSPTLSVQTVTQSFTLGRLEGAVNDLGSPIERVEVSVDDGFTWRDAEIAGNQWSFDWAIPADLDSTDMVLLIGAYDRAGNVRLTSKRVTVDTAAPDGGALQEVNVAEGRHTFGATQIELRWSPPVDNGAVTTRIQFSQEAELQTVPTQLVNGTTYRKTLDEAGTWYAHLELEDAAGNRASQRYGPWHVSLTDLQTACIDRERVIHLTDERLNRAAGEWRAVDLLDDDERSNQRQELYATWDYERLYLGWRGTDWELTGQLVIYLGTRSHGTTSPLTLHDGMLPFAADYAVVIDGTTSGELWGVDGGSWQNLGAPDTAALDWEFRHSSTEGGSTEIVLPFGASVLGDGLQLLAVALDNEQQPWAVFPTANALATKAAWTSAYEWPNLCATDTPQAGQPNGPAVAVTISPEGGAGRIYGAGETIRYRVTVKNQELDSGVDDLSLQLAATPGLKYQRLEGLVCDNCNGGADSWTIPLPPLGVGGSSEDTVSFTVVAQLGTLAGLAGQTAAETTAMLVSTSGAAPTAAVVTTAQRLDLLPPVMVEPPELSGASGVQTLTGFADDGNGSGVAAVKISQDGGITWQTAVGTQLWSAEVNVSSSVLTVSVQLVDEVGNESDVINYQITVDSVPPTAAYTLPSVVTSEQVVITGTVTDNVKRDGVISGVEVQPESEEGAWEPAELVEKPIAPGEYRWFYVWSLDRLDGIPVRLRVRAQDGSGNRTPEADSTWQELLVDNVAPVLTTTQRLEGALLGDYLDGTNTVPVIEGIVSDGSGVTQMQIELVQPDDTVVTTEATFDGTTWSYIPTLAGGRGTYRLTVVATDQYGNQQRTTPQTLTVVDSKVGFLTVRADAPTIVGATTTLTAAVALGTTATYMWDLGDGTTATGPVVQHVYPEVGTYTATVRARNAVGELQASTQVQIVAQPSTVQQIYLPIVSQRAP